MYILYSIKYDKSCGVASAKVTDVTDKLNFDALKQERGVENLKFNSRLTVISLL